MKSLKSKKYYSSKQETTIANLLDWKVVSGSGSRDLHPGDVESEEWLGECKTHETTGNNIVFYSSVWKKISDEASFKYKFPVLFVDDGSQRASDTWCMFMQEPPVEHKIVDDVVPVVGKNIRFSSYYLHFRKKEHDNTIPVMFRVTWNKEVVFISEFNDFVKMFGRG